MIRSPTLGRPKAEFSGFSQGDGLVAPRFRQHDRNLVPDRAMWSFLVVVSTPSLQLFGRIRKRQEPMCVQTLGSETAIKRFDERIIGGLAWPEEVQDDPALIGPQVHVTRYELAALINADGFRVARLPADPVQHRHDIFAAIADFGSRTGT